MQQDKINKIIAAVKVPLDHPLFFSRVFALASKSRKIDSQTSRELIRQLFAEEYEELSRRLDRSEIQESCSVRNILRTRALANLLIDDKGELRGDLVSTAISALQEHMYSLGPQRQFDAKRQEHLLSVLKVLHQNRDSVRFLKKFSRPLSNKYAEDIIRDTLQLPTNVTINDAHARRSVLSAWMTYLRQNVGSCFATAPAKVIQEEQYELFLQDLMDLLATGRLKRTFGGIEYSVPLSASWGSGDLKKPIVFQRSSDGIRPEIWYSPGLMAAFEAVKLLNSEERTKVKILQLRNWIAPFLMEKGAQYLYFICDTEEIIRHVLLQQIGLTEQQVHEYENRPRVMLQSHLMMQVPATSKGLGGLGEKVAHFLQQFEIAKNAFKGLADNALLKAWEFTLASFSETKQEFTRWNLYASLGLGSNEPGGIGQCIYQIIQRKLEEANKKVEELQYDYEMSYSHVKMLEGRMRQASTEKEIQWLKAEYQSHMSEFYTLEEIRNTATARARGFVNLYESLHIVYQELFKDYFQEVYDADMQEVTVGPFDDSPAGFRLLYKHGRSNTSQWTRIQNHSEFVDALASFFVATEPRVADALEIEGMERELSEIITAIINHVKTKEFIESSFHRMAEAHRVVATHNPLENLEKIEKKPWAYTSGGTMNTLVSCYYRLENRPKEAERWVENEVELLVFLVDTLKHIPAKLMEPFLKGIRRSMLMQSPTHAFILKPNSHPFQEAWLSDEFTYTAVRDRLIRPAQHFIEKLLLDEPMMQFLVQQLSEKVPENFRPRFKSVFSHIMGPLNPMFFRDYLVDTMSQDRGLNYRGQSVLSTDDIDSFLYTHLPLFHSYELKTRLKQLLVLIPHLTSQKTEEILNLFDQIPLSKETSILSAQHLQDICKALLCLVSPSTSTKYDYHLLISQAAQKIGFAMPAPILFADTNWVKDEFGFIVNAGTGKLELWRVDYTGRLGCNMSHWKQWLDGSRPDQKWGIYIKPPEYGQV